MASVHQGPESNGWPMGLQPAANVVRMSLVEHLRQGWSSSSSTASASTDLDTQASSISFFPDKSVTLGSLIALRRSVRAPSKCRSSGSNGYDKLRHGDGQRQQPRRASSVLLWLLLGCHARCQKETTSQVAEVPSLEEALALERSSTSRSDEQQHVYISVMYEVPDAATSSSHEFANDKDPKE